MQQSQQSMTQLIDQLCDLSKWLSEHRQEILKLQTSDFISSFVDLTAAIENLDSTRDVMLGKAETLLSRLHDTERKLRKEHLKLVHSKK